MVVGAEAARPETSTTELTIFLKSPVLISKFSCILHSTLQHIHIVSYQNNTSFPFQVKIDGLR